MSNTITGLLDAFCDSVPVVCISGQVATTAICTDAFQECDALGISRTVTKWNVQVRKVEALVPSLRKAFAIAAGARPGPVLVDVPKDVQLRPLPAGPAHAGSAIRGRAVSAPVAGGLPLGRLRNAVDLITKAARPVVYGGGGLINSGTGACAAFAELVRRTSMPCTLTLMGLGAFPTSDPQWLGMLGMHGTLEANLAMHHADLVVCVWARFDDRVTGTLDTFCPSASIVHIDVDPTSINKVVRATVPLVGDCERMLRALLDALGPRDLAPARLDAWWSRVGRWRAEQSLAYVDTPEAIAAPALMARLQAVL
jgi:acetolactate synthase-1/2/3 large subunit